MKHVYRVAFEVLWSANGKRGWWSGDEEVVRVLGNGDARPAIKHAERIVKKRTLDERSLDEGQGKLWHVAKTRLVSATRQEPVES